MRASLYGITAGSSGTPPRNYSRMLIIGNSITIIPFPNNTTWWGTWGMAATVQANDFVHVLGDLMASNSPSLVLDPEYCVTWENDHNNSFDYTFFDSMLAANPDLILIRFGENVVDLTNYQADFETLINYCKAARPTADIVVTDCEWQNATKDNDQHLAALATGVGYVSLAGIDIPANNSFIGAVVSGDDHLNHNVNDAAVALHPADPGMAAMAARIYTAIYPIPLPGPPVSDADAQAFIEAAYITDTTQRTAINNLVIGLKAQSLWTKMIAVYPFVGGNALTHKYNLMNPVDSNAAFCARFSPAGLVHSATGVTPNGVTGYANTYVSPSAMTDGDAHWSYYSRTDILETKAVMGAQTGGVGPWALLRNTALGASNILADYVSGAGDRLDGAEADSLGLHIFSATGGNGGPFKAYKRGVQLGTTKTQAGNFNAVTDTFYLFAMNGAGVATLPTTRECAFASFGSGLSDTEAANLDTIVDAFQTTLSRNV